MVNRPGLYLPPMAPQQRSLWPTDTPLAPAQGPQDNTLTQPRITLPWASSAEAEPTGAPVAEPQAVAHDGSDRGAYKPLAAEPAPPYSLDAHLSLAVALDVLATELVPIAGARRDILSDITQALLALRQGRDEQDAQHPAMDAQTGALLRSIALGPVGEARAALAEELCQCTGALGRVPSDALGVAQACEQVVVGAREVIGRARLALEALDARSRR